MPARSLSRTILLLVAATALLPVTLPSQATHEEGFVQALPVSWRWAPIAGWDGTNAWIAGGDTDRIYRYTPATGQFAEMGARMPYGPDGAAGAFDGRYLYAFGGYPDYAQGTKIRRYDTQTDTAELLSAVLPHVVMWGSAVYLDGFIYVMGGNMGCCTWESQDIFRFDPATGTLTTMSARLPHGGWALAAATDGRDIYVFGGELDVGNWFATHIQRVSPSLDSAEVLEVTLPSARRDAAAVWTGEEFLVLGGFHYNWGWARNEANAEVFAMDRGLTRLQWAPTPAGVSYAAAVWTGSNVLLFSGSTVRAYDPDGSAVAWPQPSVAPVAPQECIGGFGNVAVDASATADPSGGSWRAYATSSGSFTDPTALSTPARFRVGTHHAGFGLSRDGHTSVALAEVRITDTRPPTVSLDRPATGGAYALDEGAATPAGDLAPVAVVIGGITLRATAFDACEIASVTFETSEGGRFVDTKAPYEFFLNPPVGAPALVTIRATATDPGENTAAHEATILHAPTRLLLPPGLLNPGISNSLHDACVSALKPTTCESVVGPDPYPDW